jgi:hypothetical protein
MSIQLKFNPDTMTVSEVKEAAQILRNLIQRREMLQESCQGDYDMIAGSLLNTFDTLTQGVKV